VTPHGSRARSPSIDWSQNGLPSLRYFGLPPAQQLRLALVDPTDRYLRAWQPISPCPQFNHYARNFVEHGILKSEMPPPCCAQHTGMHIVVVEALLICYLPRKRADTYRHKKTLSVECLSRAISWSLPSWVSPQLVYTS
jgi:hypothetical protein